MCTVATLTIVAIYDGILRGSGCTDMLRSIHNAAKHYWTEPACTSRTSCPAAQNSSPFDTPNHEGDSMASRSYSQSQTWHCHFVIAWVPAGKDRRPDKSQSPMWLQCWQMTMGSLSGSQGLRKIASSADSRTPTRSKRFRFKILFDVESLASRRLRKHASRNSRAGFDIFRWEPGKLGNWKSMSASSCIIASLYSSRIGTLYEAFYGWGADDEGPRDLHLFLFNCVLLWSRILGKVLEHPHGCSWRFAILAFDLKHLNDKHFDNVVEVALEQLPARNRSTFHSWKRWGIL